MNISIFDIKEKARFSLNRNWGKAVLLTFIIFLITTGASFFIEVFLSGGLINWFEQEQTPLTADLINLLLGIILIPLTASSYWFYLNLVRGKEADISQVFTIYNDWKMCLKLIGVSIMVAIFAFLWFLLLIIPGIIKLLAYSQVYYLLRDHPEYSILEAITESKTRMVGYKWKYFLLNLSFIGWGILCIFSLGIGFLWLAPYITASNSAFYHDLIGNQQE